MQWCPIFCKILSYFLIEIIWKQAEAEVMPSSNLVEVEDEVEVGLIR